MPDEQRDLIFRKGNEHERAYLESLRAAGNTIVEIEIEIEIELDDHDWDAAQACTVAAMEAAADVVYQGVFEHAGWRGVADFLMRQTDGTYERSTPSSRARRRPAYIFQLLFYNEQLARIEVRAPGTSISLGYG